LGGILPRVLQIPMPPPPTTSTSSSIRVLVADDHEIVRHGLKSVFKDSEICIVGEATDAAEAVTLTGEQRPDVVTLDVRLGAGDGLDAIKAIREANPDTRIVMLSSFDSPTYIARAVSAGASDYVLKTASRKDLIEAVTNAARGLPPARSGEFRRISRSMANKSLPDDIDVPLTPRETQVLRLVAMGLSNQEIADSLEISIETVKEHVQNLLRKLSVGDRTQAAVWAIRHGLG
jgi:RNA polymerase sigma factor (sigma-70 family)